MDISKFINLGPDAPIETQANGAKQSAINMDFTLMDGPAMFALASVLAYGAKKYERDNWRKISTNDHLNHALTHIFAFLSNDKQDDHLEHAFCRLMMAVASQK